MAVQTTTQKWLADSERACAQRTQVNPQLRSHLQGALNGGASTAQVRAVRQLAIHVCEAAGMRVGGGGWRTEVQDL